MTSKEPDADSLDHEWRRLGLAAPARRALVGAGLVRLDDLSSRTQAEVLSLHGMGANAMRTLQAAMLQAGIAFRG